MKKDKKKPNKMVIGKKPVFRKFIERYGCMYVGIALVLAILGSLGAQQLYREIKQTDFYSNVNDIQESVIRQYDNICGNNEDRVDDKEENVDDTEVDIDDEESGVLPLQSQQEEAIPYYKTLDMNRTAKEEWETRLHMGFSSNALLNNYAIAVYNEDLTQEYINSQEAVFIILQEKEENSGTERRSQVYECPDDETWKEAWQQIKKIVKKTKDGQVTMDGIYVKGRYFYPAHVQLVVNEETDVAEDKEKEVLWETDMTPDNVEDYTYISLEDSGWRCGIGPISLGNSSDALVEQILKKGVERAKAENVQLDEDVYTWSLDGNDLFELVQIEMSDSKKIVLAVAVRYSILEDYRWQVLGIYVGMAVISLLLAWFVAYRNYHRELAHYQMDTYRRNLTNTMAHDLKTPLMAISGYAENLQQDIHPEKHKNYVNSILSNVGYMNRMIGDILELSRVENMVEPLEREEVDLHAMTENILSKYNGLMEERGLWATFEGEKKCIFANRTYMAQALDNLIGNAVKYADLGSEIFISISDNQYEIKNVYSGELDVPVEKLTEAFVKGQDSRSRMEHLEMQGNGLGLAIVKQVLELQKFSMELAQESGEFVAQIHF